MSYSLNSLKGLNNGLYRGALLGVIRGDTSLDYGSYRVIKGSWKREWKAELGP